MQIASATIQLAGKIIHTYINYFFGKQALVYYYFMGIFILKG
jgi:hypothetical protein